MKQIYKLLRSSTSRDTLVSFLGLGIIAGVGMLFSVLTARSFGPTGLGIFSALNAIVTLVSGIGDLGFSAALVNFLPKVKNDRHILISVTFWSQFISAVILSLVILSLALIHMSVIPGSTQTDFVLIGVLTGIYVFQGFASGVFNADKKFLQNSILQGLDSVIKLLLVFALVYTNNLTIQLALIANIISCSISVIYGLRRELTNIRPIFPKEQLSKIISFSKWIALTRVFSVMISRVDVIFLNLLAGAYQAGLFAAASRISLFFALLVSSLGSVIAPRFSAFTEKKDISRYLRKVLIMVGGISLIMLTSVVLAEPLVRFIFGDKYTEAIPVFQAITIAMIPFLLSVVTTQPLVYSFNQPHLFAKITVIQVICLIGLDLLLIPHYQAIAPAIALGITNTFVLVISSVKLASLLK